MIPIRFCLSGGLVLLGCFLLIPAPAVAQIMLGEVDAFATGDRENWRATGNFGQPAATPTGGNPGAFLQLNSDFAPLGAFNDTQWTGDFLSAGVNAINLDITNFSAGNGTVEIRVMLFVRDMTFPSLFTEAWTTIDPIVVAPTAGIDWQNYTIFLTPANLVHVAGSNDLDYALSNVGRLLLRHDPGAPNAPGNMAGVLPGFDISPSEVSATVGFDNITAIQIVPEPGRALLLLFGFCALSLRRARRRQ